MSRELRCKNKNCEEWLVNFDVQISVNKNLEVVEDFTKWPVGHFTCVSCGLIPIEVKV